MKLFKKSVSLLLALLMVLGLTVTAFAEDAAAVGVEVSKDSLTVGDDFSVYLTSTADIGSIGAFQMDLYYDQDLFEYVGAETDFTPNHNTSSTGDRYIRLTTIDFAGKTVIPAGRFTELKFKVKAAGSYTFKLTTVKISDIAGGRIMDVAEGATSAAVTAQEAPAFTGYAVSASEDKTVSAGENAEVRVTVSNSSADVTAYNAYDLSLTYDKDLLTYVSAAAADADATVNVDEDNGTVRVMGYGADKALSAPAVTLTFQAKAPGSADVKLTSAKVDIAAQAIGSDAPDAAILDATTVINISNYAVELGDGLTGAATAAPGTNYTFTATDAEHYDYVISATMGGEPTEVTDNGDGTYTIANVTGNLVISSQMTAKKYAVTVGGTGAADVTAAAEASYNTDFTFSVNEDASYTYSISVTVGGSAYALGTPVNGVYTVSGTAITGDIVITVTKTVKPSSVVNVTKPDYVTGSNTAVKGKDYTFSVSEDEGYAYGEPKVTVDGTDITDQLVKNDDGSYTIPGSKVTGSITIEVTKQIKTTVDVVEYITLNNQSMFLVTVSGDFPQGQVPKYDGMSMYFSEKYNAYAYLVISADGLEAVKTEAAAKVTVAEGTAAGTVAYTGDVNGTERVDVNDAQLTYDMYNAKYEAFDAVSMLKFLSADVNGDKTVNVNDAAAIIASIQ